MFLLLVSAYSTVHAESNISKDWYWDSSDPTYATALTINDKGYVLGQWCYYADGQCIYIIDFGITCDNATEYPVLVSSDLGAEHLNVTCGHKYENRNVMYASDYDQIDYIVKNATKVGFVIPLERDEFKAVRFTLAGSTYAIEKMLLEFLAKYEGRDNSKRSKSTVSDEEYY